MLVKSEEFIANPVISVIVLSYNHEKYITDCLDSILSQCCNVPFEIIIADDFSSDKTKSILLAYQKKYSNKICLLMQEKNQGLLINYADVLDLCRGKYVAQCAGDDYWCDELKLQKQYDCLENKNGFGVVRTAGWRLENGNMTISKDGEYSLEGDVRELTNHGPIGLAASFFFQRDLLQYVDIRAWYKLGITMEDYPMHAIFAHHTKFAYISDRCIVYRATPNSISKNKSFDKRIKFALGKVEVQRYLRSLYPDELSVVLSDEIINDRVTYLKLRSAIYHFDYNESKSLKKQIVTDKYKNKRYCKYYKGLFGFIVLSLLICMS